MRILLALDGSSGSSGALEWAAGLARWDRISELRVQYILAPELEEVAGVPLPLPSREEVRAKLRGTLHRIGQEVEGALPPGVSWELRWARGEVARSLVRIARRWGADLLLMGQGSRSPGERVMGGDVAARVVRLTSLPLLTTPPVGGEGWRGEGKGGGGVVGVDFSWCSEEAARLTPRILPPAAPIRLLHALPTGILGRPGEGEVQGELLRRLELLATSLREGEAGEVTVAASSGAPAELLMAEARRVGARHLSVGSHGRSFLGRVLLGSVTEALIRRWDGSLLVVPPPSRR